MLFSDTGDQLGMLSGGCLESDIHQQARRVLLKQKPALLTYDSNDEDDLAFQLGIGCGGVVHVLLQPISPDNDYLCLPDIYQLMKERGRGEYRQKVSDRDVGTLFTSHVKERECSKGQAQLVNVEDELWLLTEIKPPTHLMIAGGGMDARPLAALAHQLGWEVTLWDPRPANGRPEYFSTIQNSLNSDEQLNSFCTNHSFEAAILMTHNVELDARALNALKEVNLSYLALLGPINRRDRVISTAGVVLDDLATHLSGPAGLDIGAELPETIALSILAECQAALTKSNAMPLSYSVPISESMTKEAS